MGDREAIWVDCEGSGCPGHHVYDEKRDAMCSMCGQRYATMLGVVVEHRRRDLLAEIERGDFGV